MGEERVPVTINIDNYAMPVGRLDTKPSVGIISGRNAYSQCVRNCRCE